jgi:hypothetical protein
MNDLEADLLKKFMINLPKVVVFEKNVFTMQIKDLYTVLPHIENGLDAVLFANFAKSLVVGLLEISKRCWRYFVLAECIPPVLCLNFAS